ncbi:hypothetical protein C0993_008497 [Termitomyces sp. T159_Od127]|nr:hypothetical protein C0993_008497 [Termitomyces sp. T159_Od127]
MPRHESLRSDEQKGSGLGYYTLPQPTPSVLAERRELHRQESLRKSQARDTTDEEMIIPPLTPVPSRPTHQSYDHAPAPTYDPMNVPISSASSAAKAKARERAEKAMRDKRTEKDKDSIRKRAEREERRRSKRGEAWYPSYPGESSSSYKHNFHGATASDRLQQGNSSSRHISSYDLPPPPYTSASQRASGSGRGRYVEKYTSSHRNKYTPFRILSVTPRA